MPQDITGKAETAVVARGRSIDVPDPRDRVTTGYDDDGRPITRAATRKYTAGQQVSLPVDEIRNLRARGFLVDPDNVVPLSTLEPRQRETTDTQLRSATPKDLSLLDFAKLECSAAWDDWQRAEKRRQEIRPADYSAASCLAGYNQEPAPADFLKATSQKKKADDKLLDQMRARLADGTFSVSGVRKGESRRVEIDSEILCSRSLKNFANSTIFVNGARYVAVRISPRDHESNRAAEPQAAAAPARRPPKAPKALEVATALKEIGRDKDKGGYSLSQLSKSIEPHLSKRPKEAQEELALQQRIKRYFKKLECNDPGGAGVAIVPKQARAPKTSAPAKAHTK